MAEILDFVDEHDRVIGQDSRENIKAKNLNYRIVHIWLFNPQGDLLLCKRPQTAKTYAGLWTSSAGGHVQTGERYEQAAKREAREELGVQGGLRHAFTLDYIHPRGCHVFIDLWFARSRQKKLTFDVDEITEARFVPFTDVEKEVVEKPALFNPQFIELIRLWKHHQKEE